MKSRIFVTALASSLLITTLSATGSRADISGPNCTPLLSKAANGAAAIIALGTRLPEAAQRNQMPADKLRSLLAQDRTLWLDVCGQAYYVEEAASDTSAATSTAAAPFPYTQTFQLHSKPGSNRTIYLDFTGTTISSSYGGAWSGSLGGGSVSVIGYNTDSDPTTFSNAEQDIIQDIWRRVAEDYAPFDVDVTTEEPAPGVLERTDGTDQVYGTTAVISSDSSAFSKICNSGCGGVAYVGVFNLTGSTHEYYQPAWVFTGGTGGGTYAKYVAEATSHEVGHNLNLRHDGTSTQGYYTGSAGWAPIMGVGYYEPVAQWSKGMYPGANNTEDDYVLMANAGAALRADEDSNTAATARVATLASPVSGVIASPGDIDWVSFTPSSAGSYQFNADPAPSSPNLDIRVDVYDSALSLLATSNPTMVRVNGDIATGLSASATVAMNAGETYYLRIDGVGQGTWASLGYDDYGSLGQYTVSVTGNGALTLNASSLPQATVGRPYSSSGVNAGGGVAPYIFAATGLPAGLSMNSSTGAISGTPTATCVCAVNVTVTDNASASSTGSTVLTVAAAPAISTLSLGDATRGTAYSASLSAAGGVAPFVWSATGLPSGLTIGSGNGVISGTPSVDGTFTVNVSLTEANGAIATRSLSLRVLPPPLAITTTQLPNGSRSKNYSATVAAGGGSGARTWSISSGALPPGLVISSSTGAITGRPTTRGIFTFTVRVADSSGVATRQLSIRVN